MTYLLRALGAELLKTRRTLAIWMTLVTPLVVCVLQTLVLMRWQGDIRRGKDQRLEWLR